MSELEYYIRIYGYIGVIVWTFFGGEEGVIVSAILAREGYMTLPGIILASALGGALGDQVYFYLARKHGARLITRSAKMAKAYPRVECFVKEYGNAVVLISRFMIGLRITIPVVCGTFKMRAATYTLLNLLSALIWASMFGILAYHFGRVFWSWMHRLPRGGLLAGGFLLGLGAFLGLYLRFRRKPLCPPPRPAPEGDRDE